jgi:hypothetical protein
MNITHRRGRREREREGVLVAIMLLVVSHSFVHCKNIKCKKKTKPCTRGKKVTLYGIRMM